MLSGSGAAFLNLGTVDILDQIVLRFGGWPVYRSVSSSISGLCPLNAGSKSPSPVVTTRNVSTYCQMSPGVGSKTTPG